MGKQAGVALYVLVLSVVVVSVDVLFLKHHFLERLLVNIGIVVVFGAAFWAFTKRRSASGSG